MSSLVTMIVVLIAFILLGTAIGYNYMKKAGTTATDANDEKKKKIVGALNISAVVVLGLALVAGIWEFSIVSKTINQCLMVG